MRISDWSSDVCSSDLLRVGAPEDGVDDPPVAVFVLPRQEVDGHRLAVALDDAVLHQHRAAPRRLLAHNLEGLAAVAVEAVGEDADAEIGRASCRERVCQYV